MRQGRGAEHVTYTHSSFMEDGRAFGNLTTDYSLYHDDGLQWMDG